MSTARSKEEAEFGLQAQTDEEQEEQTEEEEGLEEEEKKKDSLRFSLRAGRRGVRRGKEGTLIWCGTLLR